MLINKISLFIAFFFLFSVRLCGQVDPAMVGVELPVFSTPMIVFNNFNELQKSWIDTKSDKIKVINFWATWCKPCIRELPYFQSLNVKENKDFELYIVSLDKPEDAIKVSDFLTKKQVSITSGLLADPNSNEWINKVSEEWTGSIPATLVIGNGQKYFFEKEFESYDDLYQALALYTKISK
jgi:thiol-disulfide isomerase/thioredoxin